MTIQPDSTLTRTMGPAAVESAPAAEAAAPSGRPIVQVQGLTKRFGEETAVQDLTFQVRPGTIFSFIGPSGCGKTTTVRLLTGAAEPTSGQLLVLGQKPAEFDAVTRRRLGYMPQLFTLYPDLTVWENLNFAASLYGLNWVTRRRHFNRLLDFVELKAHTSKLARSLSGGMQRRLSLAATLVHEPEILFLDEPTAGVDPLLRRKFWDYFKELQGQGRTLFITTQYVGEAAYCDWVGVMHHGRLLRVETPDGLRRAALGGDLMDVRTAAPIDYRDVALLQALPFVRGPVVALSPTHLRLAVEAASTAAPELVKWSHAHAVAVEAIEPYTPPFDDIFVELIKREADHA